CAARPRQARPNPSQSGSKPGCSCPSAPPDRAWSCRSSDLAPRYCQSSGVRGAARVAPVAAGSTSAHLAQPRSNCFQLHAPPPAAWIRHCAVPWPRLSACLPRPEVFRFRGLRSSLARRVASLAAVQAVCCRLPLQEQSSLRYSLSQICLRRPFLGASRWACLRWQPRGLLLVVDLRDDLPNFPHSPAVNGRERYWLLVLQFLLDRRQSCFQLVAAFQLVDLGGNHLVSTVVELQPGFEFQVHIHPAAPDIDHKKRERKTPPFQEIALDQFLPAGPLLHRNPGISVPGKIDEMNARLDPKKIDQLRTPRPRARKREPWSSRQSIQQAGFSDITSPQKGDLRRVAALVFGRELMRLRRADDQPTFGSCSDSHHGLHFFRGTAAPSRSRLCSECLVRYVIFRSGRQFRGACRRS